MNKSDATGKLRVKEALGHLTRLLWPDRPPAGENFFASHQVDYSKTHLAGMARHRGEISATLKAFYNASNRTTKWTHYFDIYDECLMPLREWLISSSITPGVLEIGTSYGGSLQMWREFFGSETVVCGLDVSPKETKFGDPKIQVIVGSQTDNGSLQDAVERLPGLHLVVDDGSHVGAHQRKSFEYLWPKLAYGGLYIVEDLHTAYWREYEGGLFRRRKTSFVDYAKHLVDVQHSHYSSRRLTTFERRSICDSVFSISFFDSIVAIRKEEFPKHRSMISNHPGSA